VSIIRSNKEIDQELQKKAASDGGSVTSAVLNADREETPGSYPDARAKDIKQKDEPVTNKEATSYTQGQSVF
jgi:hypothetical protein